MSTKRKPTRAEYERGLYGYHDPTAELGGAAPTVSALTPRIWLASIGMVLCVAAAVFALWLGVVWAGVLLVVLAATALVDLCWVVHRKRRGEPG
ncbi:hypothetical protein GCM10010174_28930 [Kutzneria viridogrisea]|uniref:Uncharacterized protein n=2 Tax=Kutzneria TaxID=43356 RepID=W5WB18_9PSEU|nr:hypothetical protein [Kutzneria albida]AHH97960.1 hypothetical protein KALB_4598 [Kutzneria albida DSM 43870]MBA8924383.1 fatty acid desaturase [Kutzneria viridogrisea]